MLETVYGWILICLDFAIDTFILILDSTGTGNFYIDGMIVIIAFSLLIAPMLHKQTPGSDTVRQVKNFASDR